MKLSKEVEMYPTVTSACTRKPPRRGALRAMLVAALAAGTLQADPAAAWHCG